MTDTSQLTILGQKVSEPTRRLELFPKPDGVDEVTLKCTEVTSLCPVTGQPDFEQVDITYMPDKWCIESKSLKLYLWAFREEGHFCEALAAKIAYDIYTACQPVMVMVVVRQSPRGGISIEGRSMIDRLTWLRMNDQQEAQHAADVSRSN